MDYDVRKHYEGLMKKYRLPEFGALEEFQVSDLEETQFLLSEIREKIVEKLDNCKDFFSDILSPDTELTNMYESRVFSDEKKKEIFNIFRRIMFWKRASLEVSISNDEAANAGFIKGFLAEWKDLKPGVAETVGKVKNSWETESEEAEKLGYFG